jgi:hypothetical protein
MRRPEGTYFGHFRISPPPAPADPFFDPFLDDDFGGLTG